MKLLLLRTIWKDMIILRWWLLAWVIALGAFAVWRNRAAAAWHAEPAPSGPAGPDFYLPLLLGFAALLAVRFMHTDNLQSQSAFWRTRPAGALHLGTAKLLAALTWLILLPVAVEIALLKHWGWNAWLWPAVADWTIKFVSSVVPGMLAGALIPGTVPAIAAGLGLAWLNQNLRPGTVPESIDLAESIGGVISAPFVAFYLRSIAGVVITLLGASGKWRWCAVIVLAALLLSGRELRIPERWDPSAPALVPGAAPAILETSIFGDRAFVRLDDTTGLPWVWTSGKPDLFQSQDRAQTVEREVTGSMPYRFSSLSYFEDEDRFAAHFLNRPVPWGAVQTLPDIRVKTGEPVPPSGVRTRRLQYGTLTDPISGELPLHEGSSWTRGPCRIEVKEIHFSSDSSKPSYFRLEFDLPHFATGQWQPSLHGAEGTTPVWVGLFNRRLGKIHTLRVSRDESRDPGDAASAALHRKRRTMKYLLNFYSWHAAIPDYCAPEGELLRDASLAFVEWRIEKRGEAESTIAPWPPPPVPNGPDEPREASKGAAALKPPPLHDEAAVRKYVDELLRLRAWPRHYDADHRFDRKSPWLDRFELLGSRWFPLIVNRIAVATVGVGAYDYNGFGERATGVDILAASMAEPSHTALLMGLMERGLPLPATIKAHPWFRQAASPRLAEIAARFKQGTYWARAMLSFHDPALHPAIVASFHHGNPGDLLYLARDLSGEPGFPYSSVLRILRLRRWETPRENRLTLALLESAAGIATGPPDAAALLADWPWKDDRSGATAGSFSEWLKPLRSVCPACPADDEAALHWLAANGSKLRWNSGHWNLD